MKKKNLKNMIPVYVCDECKLEMPAYSFTSMSSPEGQVHICSGCYNDQAAEAMGVNAPEKNDFPPITLFDSTGKEHTFYFEVRLTTGLGITAMELDSEWHPCGYRFFVLDHPETPVMGLYEELIEKMKSGLSVRYFGSSDFPGAPLQNRLYIKGSAVVGRVEENKSGSPVVVVDGQEYSWEEFGECLSPYTGFNFRLECKDLSDEVDICPRPERPDKLWWLPEVVTASEEEERDIH